MSESSKRHSKFLSLIFSSDLGLEIGGLPFQRVLHTIAIDICIFFFYWNNWTLIYRKSPLDSAQKQGSKFKFEFASTCATRCKFLGALPKS